jgi:hypothetical protein
LTLETLFTVAENHVTEHMEQLKSNVTQFKANNKNPD